MKICHVCSAEVEDNVELCSVCGADLTVQNEYAEDTAETTIIENPVLAVSVEDVVTAEIFMDVLKDNNIPFTCGEETESQSMRIVFGGGFVAQEIYVDEENLEEAKKLYKEVLESEAEFQEFEDGEV